jgi:hypothetical protein
LITSAIVALYVAAGVPALAQQPVINLPPVPPNPISIQAPSNVQAGAELCFTVTCYGGAAPSVLVEVEEVWIPSTVIKTDDPSVWVVCCRVPGGASQSAAVITAVHPHGGTASATVNIH